MIKMTIKQFDWYSRHFYGKSEMMTNGNIPCVSFHAMTSEDISKISRLEKIFSDYKVERDTPMSDHIKVYFDNDIVISVVAWNTKNTHEREIIGQCQALLLGQVLQRDFVKNFLDKHPNYSIGFEIMANVEGVYLPL